MIIPYLAA